MHVYSEQGKIVRLQLYPHKDVSSRTEEFYLRGGKLVFALIQDKGPAQEGAESHAAGKALYFKNGKLLEYADRSKEPEASVAEEKKMYETRLPYEVSELLAIVKKK